MLATPFTSLLTTVKLLLNNRTKKGHGINRTPFTADLPSGDYACAMSQGICIHYMVVYPTLRHPLSIIVSGEERNGLLPLQTIKSWSHTSCLLITSLYETHHKRNIAGC